jgi:hypothetical protein
MVKLAHAVNHFDRVVTLYFALIEKAFNERGFIE